MKNKKVVIVLDVLLFESLNNDSLVKLLTKEYFLLLWTSTLETDYLHKIPYDGHINGLRNGCKPFRYLRLFLRRHHPDVLCLPTVIVDFEKNYTNSRYGYDMCVNVCDMVVTQNYNNRPVNVIDVRRIFTQVDMFVQQYASVNNVSSVVSEGDLLSDNFVLTSRDLFTSPTNRVQTNKRRGKQQIADKKFILTVGSSFFTLHHNAVCKKFIEFLGACHLVVWMNNKNVSQVQVQHFMTALRANNVTVDYMLFGLDRHVKSISYIRRNLAPTQLPFILVDTLSNIYDTDDVQASAFCDFDFYININEYLINGAFYDMNSIIDRVSNFIQNTWLRFQQRSIPSSDKMQIVEFPEQDDDDDDDDDEYVKDLAVRRNETCVNEVDDEWRNRINHNKQPLPRTLYDGGPLSKRRRRNNKF